MKVTVNMLHLHLWSSTLTTNGDMGLVSDLATRSPAWASFAYGLLPIAFIFLFVSVAPAQRRSFSANAFRGGLLWLTFVGVVALASHATRMPCASTLSSAAGAVVFVVLAMLLLEVPLWSERGARCG